MRLNYSDRQKLISYILKIIVIVSAVVGTLLSAFSGKDEFMGGTTVFMYFTIQSNIALAIIAAAGIYYLKKDRVGSIWSVVKFVGTVSITLTGVVFCVVLAPTMGSKAWNLQNVLTHVVVPVLSIVDFYVTGISTYISKRKVIFVLLPPICYAIYAGIGYALKWQFAAGLNYPYFFLNWGSPAGAFGFSRELPFMGCVWWILVLLFFLLLVGYLYLKLLDGVKRKYNDK